MKKMTVSLLALTALVGGTMLASAAATPQVGATYFENISFSNAPSLIDFVDFPVATVHTNIDVLSSTIEIDISGKIEGVAVVRATDIQSVTDTNSVTTDTVVGFSDFMCNISGKISNKKTDTAVQMSIKGSGYSASNSPAPSDFFTVSSGVKPAKLALNFSGSIATADIGGTNTLAGTLTGSINPGLKAINDGKPVAFKKEAATANFESSTINNLNLDIVQVANKYYVADENFDLSGSGSSSTKGTFAINLKGFGRSHGANVKLTGSTGDLVIGTDGTNNIVVPNAPLSGIELKGKVEGQNIDVTGGTANIED